MAIGDADFASNSLLGFQGNQDFVYAITTGRDETWAIGGGEDGVLRITPTPMGEPPELP